MEKRGNFKKIIGYIQLFFGVLLIIFIPLSYNYIKYKSNQFYEGYTYSDYTIPKLDPDTAYGQGVLTRIDNLYIATQVSRLFVICFEFIIFVLSFMFVLQGLINIKE